MEKTLIYEYLYKKLNRLQCEYYQRENNLSYRKLDEVDCIDYIILLNRIKMLNEITEELQMIFKYTE